MFFTSVAHAMGSPAAGGAPASGADMLTSFIPLILMLGIFWFLLIRPQKKRAQEHKTMLENLKRGDYVITSGGMVGRIIEIDAEYVLMECGESKLRLTRGAIGALHNAPSGSGKSNSAPASGDDKKGC